MYSDSVLDSAISCWSCDFQEMRQLACFMTNPCLNRDVSILDVSSGSQLPAKSTSTNNSRPLEVSGCRRSPLSLVDLGYLPNHLIARACSILGATLKRAH